MRTPALLAAAAALVLAATPAFAQSDAPQGGPPQAGMGPGRHGGHGDWAAKRAEMRQQRMQDLKTVLRIRPEQEAAFQAFEASMTPEHGPGDHGPDGRGPGGPDGARATETTPQALDKMAAWQAKREQRMAARAEGVKRFYAALSPEQQKVFDALRRLSHEHGGHHGFGSGHDHGGPGGPGGPGPG
jgi:protein CpxP